MRVSSACRTLPKKSPNGEEFLITCWVVFADCGEVLLFIADEEHLPEVLVRIGFDFRDAVDHSPLEVELHHDADGLGQTRIQRHRKVESADLAGFDQFVERRQRSSVLAVDVELRVVAHSFGGQRVRLTIGLSSNRERNTEIPSTIEVRSLFSMRRQSW